MIKEPTNKEIMEAIGELHEAVGDFSNRAEMRFEKIESQMVTKDYLEDRLAAFETKVVTKDYLDEKLSDLKNDLIRVVHKEDDKVGFLVDILHKNKVLSKEDKKHIL